VRAFEILGSALAAALVVVGGVFVASSAQAAPHVGPAGRLQLTTAPDPLGVRDLAPGETAFWRVDASLLVEDRARLWLAVDGTGRLSTDAAALRVELRRCGVAWASSLCPSGDESVVLPDAPVASLLGTAGMSLGTISPTSPAHLLATVRLPSSAFVGQDGTLRLTFTADGDASTVSTDDSGRLPTTGATVGGPLLLGAGLLLGGVVLASVRGRRRASRVVT
jgi:hypothetical protein